MPLIFNTRSLYHIYSKIQKHLKKLGIALKGLLMRIDFTDRNDANKHQVPSPRTKEYDHLSSIMEDLVRFRKFIEEERYRDFLNEIQGAKCKQMQEYLETTFFPQFIM